MRKLMLGLAGASALAMGSAANATLVVSTTDQVSAVTGPESSNGGMIFTFGYTSTCGSSGAAPAGAVTCGPTYSPFEATVQFMNDVAGFYGLGLQTTATTNQSGIIASTDVDFFNSNPLYSSGAYLTTTGGDFIAALGATAGSDDIFEGRALSGLFLDAGTYVIHVTGERGNGSSFTGTLNFAESNAPVPEPATWAMMLLGFGAVGFQLRRRRSTVLTQAA